jgi:hypothetical protein
MEQISVGTDKNNNYIVPDEILEAYYKELPNGTLNQSKTKRAFNGGLLSIFGNDPERDREIQSAGGKALQAALRQRQSNKEVIDILYRKKAPKEFIERLGLEEDATIIEAINAAQALEAMRGNSKAYEVLRDTAGEKPATEVNATLEEITPEDKELLQRVNARLNSNT